MVKLQPQPFRLVSDGQVQDDEIRNLVAGGRNLDNLLRNLQRSVSLRSRVGNNPVLIRII
jgi:hypothetical protein